MGRGKRVRPEHIGRKLKAIREHLGLTQDEIANKLGFETISFPHISSYEHGRLEPPYPVTLKCARMVRISTDILIDDNLKLPKRMWKPKLRCVHARNERANIWTETWT